MKQSKETGSRYGLHKPTHRIGTNGMPEPPLGMEIQGFKIKFNTHNT
jgi:hypothetical protein